jgi:hypothetical protein
MSSRRTFRAYPLSTQHFERRFSQLERLHGDGRQQRRFHGKRCESAQYVLAAERLPMQDTSHRELEQRRNLDLWWWTYE